MKRSFPNKENIKYVHGRHNECMIYDLSRISDAGHKVIKHYPIRISISNTAQLNFKLLSHRFACMRKGNNSVAEILCSFKFNIETLCTLCD